VSLQRTLLSLQNALLSLQMALLSLQRAKWARPTKLNGRARKNTRFGPKKGQKRPIFGPFLGHFGVNGHLGGKK
jgi:hypothetical protein